MPTDCMTGSAKNQTPMLSETAQDLVAGSAAGVAITLSGHPFDTIKVRRQIQAISSSGQMVSTPVYRNALQGAIQTVKDEGVWALWKGMKSPLVTGPLVNAIVFACNEGSKRAVARHLNIETKHLSVPILALCGGVAGLINSVVVGPIELVKSRLQVQYERHAHQRQYRGPIDCLVQMIKTEGLRSPMNGMVATVLREVPCYIAQFGAYEYAKSLFLKSKRPTLPLTSPKLSSWELLISGGIGGVACWLASYPQDMIKSRLQVAKVPYPTTRLLGVLKDGGFYTCGKQLVHHHGWRGLWIGFSPCAARAFLANAVGFYVYESVAAALK